MNFQFSALVAILFSLIACGSDPSSDGQQPVTAAPTDDGVTYQPEDPNEIVVEYRKEGDVYALTVEDTSDLPECTRALDQKLAWVKRNNKFFSCQQNTWTEILIQGEPGPKGDPGEDGQPVSPNQWFDPVTELAWLLGAPSATFALASSACGDGYRMPTGSEASMAVAHGLLIASAGLSGPSDVWVSDAPALPPPNDFPNYVNASGLMGPTGVPATHGIACVEE